MKTCNKCNIEQPVGNFYKQKTQADGYRSACKVCMNSARRSRESSPEFKARKALSDRQSYEKHKIERLAAQKRYRDSPEVKARQQVYNKEYLQSNKERRTAAEFKRRAKARDGVDIGSIEASVRERKRIKDDPCFYCGEVTAKMQIDHFFPVSKGGKEEPWNLVQSCSTCNNTKRASCGTKFMLSKLRVTNSVLPGVA